MPVLICPVYRLNRAVDQHLRQYTLAYPLCFKGDKSAYSINFTAGSEEYIRALGTLLVTTKMAATMIDLTQLPYRTEFSGTSEENVAFAKTFWQSVQLHPPMESRLVSSDIRQRLKVAAPGSQGEAIALVYFNY